MILGKRDIALMVVETTADQSVPWMQPVDTPTKKFMQFDQDSKTVHESGLQGVQIDGQVVSVSKTSTSGQKHRRSHVVERPIKPSSSKTAD